MLLSSADPAAAEALAGRLFADTQVVSMRRELRRLGDDGADSALYREAERSMTSLISARLANHRPTVAVCSLSARELASLLALARSAKAPAHLVVIDDPGVSGRAAQDLARVRRAVTREGFATARVIGEPGRLTGAVFGDGDLRDIDVIGDVHGCLDELRALLLGLGYRDLDTRPAHPDGRVAVFVGDLVDHGPDSAGVVLLVDRMVAAGCALIGACGNHDWRLFKRLVLRRRTADHGNLADTLAQFADAPEAVEALARLFTHAPSHSVFDNGRLVVCHGATRPDLLGQRPVRDRDDEASELSMYGERLGGVDDDGLLRRSHRWINAWPVDGPTVVFGHDVIGDRPRRFAAGNVVGLDTGCADGGSLSALRWPTQEIVSVPAQRASELVCDLVAA